MCFYRKVKFRLNSSCHVKIKFWKCLVWILRAQKNASFLFFIFFLLGRYSRHFCQRSYGKPPVFITNIKSSHNFPHFHKDLRSRNFGQWNSGPLKKMKKLRFLAADFEKCKKGKKLNFSNLSNMARSTLILKDCDIGSYPCSKYRPSNLLFRFNNSCNVLGLKFLWKSMKLWELLISVIKTGSFFIYLW